MCITCYDAILMWGTYNDITYLRRTWYIFGWKGSPGMWYTIKFLKINEYFNGKGNIIKQPCFTEIRGTDAYRVVGNLENSDFVVNNTFWVGVYPGMTDTMIDYMAQVIKEAVNK